MSKKFRSTLTGCARLAFLALALSFGAAHPAIAHPLGNFTINHFTRLEVGQERVSIHFHRHMHGGRTHSHPHLHDHAAEDSPATHHGLRLGKRPLLIGMMHGLAVSAALMLLVLSTISSPLVGMAYICVFGVGSIGGMMLMSILVSLPLRLTAERFSRANLTLRSLSALFSLGFGLFMVYEIGFVEGLFH